KLREHALFAVLGEGMQIKKAIIGGSGIKLEVAGVDEDAQGGVDGQRHAIYQTVRHLNGVDGEGPNTIALASFNGVQFGILEQAMLFQFVLDISEGELGAIDGH